MARENDMRNAINTSGRRRQRSIIISSEQRHMKQM